MKFSKDSRVGQLLDGTHKCQIDALLAQPNVFSPERVSTTLRSATDDVWEQSYPQEFHLLQPSRSEAARERKRLLSE